MGSLFKNLYKVSFVALIIYAWFAPSISAYSNVVNYESDWLFVIQEEGTQVIIEANSNRSCYDPGPDPYLWVYNSNNQLVAQDDDGNHNSEANCVSSLVIVNLAPDSYRVRAGYYPAQQGIGFSSGSYELVSNIYLYSDQQEAPTTDSTTTTIIETTTTENSETTTTWQEQTTTTLSPTTTSSSLVTEESTPTTTDTIPIVVESTVVSTVADTTASTTTTFIQQTTSTTSAPNGTTTSTTTTPSIATTTLPTVTTTTTTTEPSSSSSVTTATTAPLPDVTVVATTLVVTTTSTPSPPPSTSTTTTELTTSTSTVTAPTITSPPTSNRVTGVDQSEQKLLAEYPELQDQLVSIFSAEIEPEDVQQLLEVIDVSQLDSDLAAAIINSINSADDQFKEEFEELINVFDNEIFSSYVPLGSNVDVATRRTVVAVVAATAAMAATSGPSTRKV